MYIDISEEIQKNAKINKYEEDSGILKKLTIYQNNSLFDDLLNHFLKSEEFYRMLFYKEILIIEGETEKIILKKIYKNISSNSHFFCVNGKAFLPFFAELFIYFNKKLKIVFDSDRKINPKSNKYTTAVAITNYFEEKHNKISKIFEYDLENHFNIDLDYFRISNGFNNKNKFMVKQFAAEEFFKNGSNLEKFIKFIK